MYNVIVFSPSRLSLYTICVSELLLRQGLHVSSLVIRKLVNPDRFRSELKRDGKRLLRKIVRKLLLRQHAYASKTFETIADLIKSENISFKSVDELGRAQRIPVLYCQDLNDPTVVAELKQHAPHLVVFTGGGLIRKQVLESSGAGVLNCHAGILPAYRGMDVIEWAILEGNWEEIGISVHFMDTGVDTGDILHIQPINLPEGIRRTEIRDLFEPVMVRTLVNTTKAFLEGSIQPRPQAPEQGRQYFSMHPRLLRLVEMKLSHR